MEIPAVPPSFSILCHTDVLASAALSQISMLQGAQSRQGAGRQDISRWKTIGKTPNPFPEQGKGPRSLLLPQCCAFGVQRLFSSQLRWKDPACSTSHLHHQVFDSYWDTGKMISVFSWMGFKGGEGFVQWHRAHSSVQFFY